MCSIKSGKTRSAAGIRRSALNPSSRPRKQPDLTESNALELGQSTVCFGPLGLALHFDMTQWFTPTADNFFSKVPKSRIVQSLAEAGTPLMVDTAQLQKADLAARAEKAIQ
ncbi:MAG: hypothetical protein JO150_14690, partial [Acidobacteriaceae bacterium]|nr:hypothetical protein [Acidobacteriaceae bacterium]